jgi:oxygen-independent coproporphyrinogen-3 oxidase
VATKRYSEEVLHCVIKELSLQRHFLEGEKVETIYFGGGTPSMIEAEKLFTILDAVYNIFPVTDDVEITIEINPDDATPNYLSKLSQRFNRLSIGIQSFVEKDLSLLGRKHNAAHAFDAITNARKAGFDNISIDLIYGINENHENWLKTLDTALSLSPEHISAYALTVEEKTILYNNVKQGNFQTTSDNIVETQYHILTQKLSEAGYDHYEISNFSKPGYASKHNSAYWNGKSYLGVGPSAHSYNGKSRQWNVSNLSEYCQNIAALKVPATMEELTETDKYNEFIMLRLRQKQGLLLSELQRRFGTTFSDYFKEKIRPFILSGHVINDDDNRFYLPESAFLIADYIIAAMFK